MIAPPPVIEPLQYGMPSFNETFNQFNAGPDGGPEASHRWRTVLKGGDDASSRSLSNSTWFGDASDGGSNPFKAAGYGVAFTAEKVAQPYGRTWRSGVLTTKLSFSQLYGYFEASMSLPVCTKGAWPAFWLLPEQTPGWPVNGEIDTPETIGNGNVYWTAISGAGGVKSQVQQTSYQGCIPGHHTYGVLWQPDTIAFYYDRKLVAQTPTPPDFTEPMYMLLDLNVGGQWPGDPDPALRSVQMFVSRVSAWTIPE